MTRTIIGTAALIGSLAFGATAFAADYGSSGTADATSAAAKADMMDTNKDGNISAARLFAYMRVRSVGG